MFTSSVLLLLFTKSIFCQAQPKPKLSWAELAFHQLFQFLFLAVFYIAMCHFLIHQPIGHYVAGDHSCYSIYEYTVTGLFMGVTIFHPWTHLLICTLFLSIALSGKVFPGSSYCAWWVLTFLFSNPVFYSDQSVEHVLQGFMHFCIIEFGFKSYSFTVMVAMSSRDDM